MRPATIDVCFPVAGDCAETRDGRVWSVLTVEYHMDSTDVSWITLQCEGLIRRITLAEWIAGGIGPGSRPIYRNHRVNRPVG